MGSSRMDSSRCRLRHPVVLSAVMSVDGDYWMRLWMWILAALAAGLWSHL